MAEHRRKIVKGGCEGDQQIRLSKTLCYLLRHGGRKENLKIYKGGWFLQKELLAFPSMRNYTNKDVDLCVESSVSFKDTTQKRFATCEVNGLQYYRATYNRTDSEEGELDFPEYSPDLDYPKEIYPVPSLMNCCYKNIGDNIKSWTDFSAVLDPYLLDGIMLHLRHRKLLNNTTLKLFLTPSLTSLELTRDVYISDSTLKRIGILCPDLVDLKVQDCLCLTDNIMAALTKKLTKLKKLEVSDCKYLGDAALTSLTRNCKSLKSIIAENCAFTLEGMQKYVELNPQITLLRYVDAMGNLTLSIDR
eukprot:TRINITY_DN13337_c0_g1_i1.p1 TRINITY_DN13337_c0_g1~~TRINITY_DN13337_c0_g1_i1.p1  ORF type:complete len:304 (-),score=55.74 TRINITY_DN13337_c0_g1_i1:41-952(-)